MEQNTFWKDKSVFVTGAAGFVGSQMCISLHKRGAKVIAQIKDTMKILGVTSDLKTGIKWVSLKGIDGFPSSFVKFPVHNVISGDCRDLLLLTDSMTRFVDDSVDVVFHLAAQAIVGRAKASPIGTLSNNISSTLSVLEASYKIHGEIKKPRAIIIASSDKAYGDQKQLPYTEDSPLNGRNPYDASKAICDILAQTYATLGLPTGIVRCGNIYGPGDNNLSRIIPGTILSVLKGETPVIRSDGTPERDYLYIEDCINGYLATAKYIYENPDKAGEAFNLSFGTPISVIGLFEEIIEACGVEGVKPNVLGKKGGEISRQWLNPSKALRTLDWECNTNSSNGLEKTVRWWKEK